MSISNTPFSDDKIHSYKEKYPFADPTAFKCVEIDIIWEGKGIAEKGFCSKSGKELVAVNSRYYRPSEVELLQGDSTYAEKKLGWKPETSLEELIKIMVEYDLKFSGYGFD